MTGLSQIAAAPSDTRIDTNFNVILATVDRLLDGFIALLQLLAAAILVSCCCCSRRAASAIWPKIRDLAAADGGVALQERLATALEVGRSLRWIRPSLGVRLLRAGRPIGFWEEAAETIQAGDAIIEIVALTEAASSASAL